MTKKNAKITHGLIIREPWISLILDGKKDWELRSTATKIRGDIALIAAGTGCVVGVATLTGTTQKLSRLALLFNRAHHRLNKKMLKSKETTKWNIAWVLKNSRRLKTPVAYRHPSGAVVWIKFDQDTQVKIMRAMPRILPSKNKAGNSGKTPSPR